MSSDFSHIDVNKPLPAGPQRPYTDTRTDATYMNDPLRPYRQSFSTNPFDTPQNASNPPPVPPRPYFTAPPPPPPLPPLPPPHLLNAHSNANRYTPPSSGDMKPFPTSPSPDLDARYGPLPSTSSNSTRPLSPPAYEDQYFNNPWGPPPPTSAGTGSLGPPETNSLRRRTKSSVDLRATSGSRAQTISTFVAPTMSFPMPEIPPLPSHQPSLGRATSATATLPSAPAPPRASVDVNSFYPQSVVSANGHNTVSGPSVRPSSAQPPLTSTPEGQGVEQWGLAPASETDITGKRRGSSAGAAPPTSFDSSIDKGRQSSGSVTPTSTEGGPSGPARRPSSGRSGGSAGARGEFRFSPNLIKLQHAPSVTSFQSSTSSYYRHTEDYVDGFSSPTEVSELSTDLSALSPTLQSLQELAEDNGFAIAKELSNLSQDMDENVLRFQKGELPEPDQEWHRLVPEEALKALEDSEIKRQGIIFEFLKAEREYVADLETMEEIFIKGIMESSPPIIPEANMSTFVNEVFGNLHEILVHHQKMLEALFERQRDTHPLIHSVADIILETSLKPEFRDAYEKYIKHYPVAESFHTKELKSNPAYVKFLSVVSREPRVKKRDMKIFLSRPLTRLVRLNMLVEQMLKRTNKDHDHPDVDTLPIIISIISDCIKATQPGIEAAEQKVKFWDLIENIVFQRGEITELALLDKERHLVHMGPVWRKTRSETGFSGDKWQEVTAALLDNYFILCRDTRFQSGVTKKVVISRPLPLAFVRMASFESAPEMKRDKIEDGGILDAFRTQNVPLYPFTIFHSSPTLMKAYTLYVPTDALRQKWKAAFVDALGVHQVRQESNQWFAQDTLVDGVFRIPRDGIVSPTTKATGRVTAAVPFATQNGQRFLAVGCGNGVYIAPYNKPKELSRVFTYSNPTYLAALQSLGEKQFNKFIIHADNRVISYSLELVARFATTKLDPKLLEASKENVTGLDQNVMFVRHVIIQGRALLVYASKKRLSSSMTIHAVEAVAQSIQRNGSTASSFRQYGQPGYLPKEATDLVALNKTVNICTKGGLVSANPGDFPNTASSPLPVIQDSGSNTALSTLKSKIDNAKPLGLVKSSPEEFMVIYDDIGCYMNSRGHPTRNYGFVKWETKATSYAHRNGLVLLISPRFIEIREASSGQLVQVIEGGDIRLLYSEPEITPHDNIILAMRGKYNDSQGLSEKLVELITTVALPSANGNSNPPASVWSEWDM